MDLVSRASPIRSVGWWTKLRWAIFGRPRATTGATDPLTRAMQLEGTNPQEAVRLYGLATAAFIESGQYEPAVQVLKRTTVLMPEQPDLHSTLAQCLIQLGRREEAALSFRRAAALAEVRGQTAWAQHLLDTAEWVDPVSRMAMRARHEAAVAPLDREAAPLTSDLALPAPIDMSDGPTSEPDTQVSLPSFENLQLTGQDSPMPEPEVFQLDDEDFEPLEVTSVDPPAGFRKLDE